MRLDYLLRRAGHLPGRDLGGIHPQLPAAQALDPEPDPRQADVAGGQHRLPPDRHRGDDGRVRGEVRARSPDLAAVHRLHVRRFSARLQLLDHQLPAHRPEHDAGRAALDDRPARDDDADRVHPRHAAGGVDGLAAVPKVHLQGPLPAAADAFGDPRLPARPGAGLHPVVPASERFRRSAATPSGRSRTGAASRSGGTSSTTRSCRPLRSSSARSAPGRSACAR